MLAAGSWQGWCVAHCLAYCVRISFHKKDKYEKGRAKVGIEEIDENHPFYSLSGTDNIVALTTKNYSKKPFVIKAPGAGADFTAFGVFIDIMRISNYLG